jgi:hypothetical protein
MRLNHIDMQVSNVSAAHIGFVLTGEADVRPVYEPLTAAGVEIKTERTGGPNIYFMCVGPDGIVLDVQAPLGKRARRAAIR